MRPRAWMAREPVGRVMAALGAGGPAPAARFVGGCVRDSLLGRRVSDVDIACAHPPEEATRRLAAVGISAAPTGLAHGTVSVFPSRRSGAGSIEVTTLRRDVATHGRRATVEFSADWLGDAARRDFTFNAMYADPDGTLYDPFGGIADLDRGRVRFIGFAARRIHEDYLRILRYFRFLAWYGRVRPDRHSLNAVSKGLAGLGIVSAERLRGETLRLLAAPDPCPAVAAMAATGVLARILGGWGNPAGGEARRALAGLARLVRAERALAREDPFRRLMALLPAEEGARPVGERLRLSRRERARIRAVREAGAPPRTAAAARRAVWESGREGAVDRILLGAALAGRPGAARAGALARGAQAAEIPAFPVRGGDVEPLAPPGPMRGRLLAEVEAWWAGGGFRAGRAACLGELRRRAGADARPGPTARRRGGAAT